jgi:hypothetical protein
MKVVGQAAFCHHSKDLLLTVPLKMRKLFLVTCSIVYLNCSKVYLIILRELFHCLPFLENCSIVYMNCSIVYMIIPGDLF